MFYLRRYGIIFPVSIVISFLTLSCAETKFSQCEKIYSIANSVASETESLTNSGQETEMKTWLQAADTMEKAAQDMKSLNISDSKLQEYQSGFIKMYKAYAESTRNIVKAREIKDVAAAKNAQKKVQKAGDLEQELGNGINSYCRGNS